MSDTKNPLVEMLEPELRYEGGELEFLVLEESWADYVRALRTGLLARVRDGGKSVSMAPGATQISAELGVYRTDYEAGDRAALIDALRLVCRYNVPLPYWAADGILESLNELDAKPDATLHSVFGMENRYPVSAKRDPRFKGGEKARAEWRTKQRLYMAVSWLIQAKGMAKGKAIQKAIADEKLPVCVRNAHDWYAEVEAIQQKHLRAMRGVKLHKLR